LTALVLLGLRLPVDTNQAGAGVSDDRGTNFFVVYGWAG